MKHLLMLSVFSILYISVNAFADVGFVNPLEGLSKGVNFSHWFEKKKVSDISYSHYTKQDVINLKELGGNVMRLPIYFHDLTVSDAPNYIVDPALFNYLDEVVTWAEEEKIFIILDNHSKRNKGSSDFFVKYPELNEDKLIKIWQQIAARYKDRSEYILYEIFNEPNVNFEDEQRFYTVQGKVIDAIREVDSKHTIIVSANVASHPSFLNNLPYYEDNNLLYTFHLYLPLVFTHKGAPWLGMTGTKDLDIPFLYEGNESRMDALSAEINTLTNISDFARSRLNDHVDPSKTRGSIAFLDGLLKQVSDFAEERNVRVYCGEFGATRTITYADRAEYYQVMRELLDKHNIPWTIWDFKGEFGLYKINTAQVFETDLNLDIVESLGFDLPSSYNPEPIPVDQCDYTFECKKMFGQTATDCKNSRSEKSVCMCGNQLCE